MLPGPATVPTMYFIGVTTGSSSIMATFPAWAAELGLGEVRLTGIDLPVQAPRADYRRVVDFIAGDRLSLGALVTTHKMSLYEACADRFGWTDPAAALMRELSCLAKRDGRLGALAKDPVSAGLAVAAILEPGYWSAANTDLILLGAGGAATAISWYLTRPERGDDRPARIVVTDRRRDRLAALRGLHDQLGTEIPVEVVLAGEPGDNDRVVAGGRPGSLIVNATGLGKDAPGSPLSSQARFPAQAVAWELNYRGDLLFRDQARAAGVRAEDGWVYFIHGWTQVIAEVFGVVIPVAGPRFDRLSDIAAVSRP